jgi:hypothetical protein
LLKAGVTGGKAVPLIEQLQKSKGPASKAASKHYKRPLGIERPFFELLLLKSGRPRAAAVRYLSSRFPMKSSEMAVNKCGAEVSTEAEV